jgi:hypothetical protein
MSEILEEGGRIAEDDNLILVPEGLYRVKYLHYETRRSSGKFSPKVVMFFAISETGAYQNLVLAKFYNVSRIDGSARRGGGFVPARRGDLYRDYVRLLTEPHRTDRIRLSRYGDHEWDVNVVTVVTDSSDRSIPETARYSKISAIIAPSASSHPCRTSALARPSSSLTYPTLDGSRELGFKKSGESFA